jgi:hypothetical protein
LGIDGSGERDPDFFDLDGGLIHSPGIIPGFQMRSASLVQFGSRHLHPTIDGGVIHVEPTFQHHLFEVSITERIAQRPAKTQQNDLRLEMTPREGMLLSHEEISFLSFSSLYQISFLFAPLPICFGWATHICMNIPITSPQMSLWTPGEVEWFVIIRSDGKYLTKWMDLAPKRGRLPPTLETETHIPGQTRSPSGFFH